MSFAEFEASVKRDSAPPAGLSGALQGLWHQARGEWAQAHTCAQDDHSREGSWVHALLHREEGDLGNAGYWYARAGRRMPAENVSLADEWRQIAEALLGKTG